MELRFARDIQEATNPATSLSYGSLQLTCLNRARHEVSRNYVDVIPRSGHCFVSLGAVVGTGISAALVIMALRQYFAEATSHIFAPQQVLGDVTRRVVEDVGSEHRLNVMLIRIDDDGHFVYSGSGDVPLMHFEKNSSASLSLVASAVDQSSRLAAGDRLLMATTSHLRNFEEALQQGSERGFDDLVELLSGLVAETTFDDDFSLVAGQFR